MLYIVNLEKDRGSERMLCHPQDRGQRREETCVQEVRDPCLREAHVTERGEAWLIYLKETQQRITVVMGTRPKSINSTLADRLEDLLSQHTQVILLA